MIPPESYNMSRDCKEGVCRDNLNQYSNITSMITDSLTVCIGVV